MLETIQLEDLQYVMFGCMILFTIGFAAVKFNPKFLPEKVTNTFGLLGVVGLLGAFVVQWYQAPLLDQKRETQRITQCRSAAEQYVVEMDSLKETAGKVALSHIFKLEHPDCKEVLAEIFDKRTQAAIEAALLAEKNKPKKK
jgi:hypothetical protein